MIVGFLDVCGVLSMIVVIVVGQGAARMCVMRVAEGAKCMTVSVSVAMAVFMGVDEIPVSMFV